MDGTALVEGFEGFSATPYKDIAGYWTIGYGHKIVAGDPYWPVGSVNEITQAQAQALLATDMGNADACVRNLVTVPLNSNQRAALNSFVFNVGCNAFSTSTLLRYLNQGNYAAVPAQMNLWVYAGGQVSDGLIARRQTEASTFMA